MRRLIRNSLALLVIIIVGVGVYFAANSATSNSRTLSTTTGVQTNGTIQSSATSVSSISSVSTLEFGSEISVVTVGNAPYGLAYDSSTGLTYVAVSGENSVAIINNKSQVTGTISLGAGNQGSDFVAFDPANDYLYTYVPGNNSMVVINPSLRTIVADFPVGSSLGWVTYDPASRTIYDVSRETNEIFVISNLTIEKSISVEGLPFAAAFDPFDGNMYVTSNFGMVFVINGTTNTLTRSVQVGNNSTDLLGIAYSPFNHEMYVSSYGDNKVYVVNSTSVIGSISGFNEPIGLVFNPNEPVLYVVNSGNATVSAWTNNQSITVSVGASPREVLFNSELGALVVTNYGNETVSIIDAR